MSLEQHTYATICVLEPRVKQYRLHICIEHKEIDLYMHFQLHYFVHAVGKHPELLNDVLHNSVYVIAKH